MWAEIEVWNEDMWAEMQVWTKKEVWAERHGFRSQPLFFFL